MYIKNKLVLYYKQHKLFTTKYPLSLLFHVISGFISSYLLISLFHILFYDVQNDTPVLIAFALSIFMIIILIWSIIFIAIVNVYKEMIVDIKYNSKSLSVIQSILVTIMLFSVIYYILQLCSDNKAITGITDIVTKNSFYYNDGDILSALFAFILFVFDNITYEFNLTAMIDCLYFSTIVISTLGFGDILPATSIAKIMTMSELIFGFSLISISLGASFTPSLQSHKENEMQKKEITE